MTAVSHPITISIGAVLDSSIGEVSRSIAAQMGGVGRVMERLSARGAAMDRLSRLRDDARAAGEAWRAAQGRVRELQAGRDAYTTRGLEAARRRVAELEARLADADAMSSGQRARLERSLAAARERLATQEARAAERYQAELSRLVDQAGQGKGKHLEAQRAVAGLSAELAKAGVNTRSLAAEQAKLGAVMAALEQRAAALARAQAAERANRERIGHHVGAIVSAVGMGLSLARPLLESMDLEAQIARVGAVSGATAEQMRALTEEARRQGRETKYTAIEAAQGMEYLAMAGFNASQSIQAIGGVLRVAAAAGADLGRTADIVSNVLTGFGLAADQAGRVGDVLAKTFTSSNTTLESLGETLKYVAPVAAQAGASLELVAAMAGVMGDAGIQGSMAGTALRSTFLRLIDPAKAGQKAMEQMGISAEQMRELMAMGDLGGGVAHIKRMGIAIADEQGNLRNWMDILLELSVKMRNMTQQEKLAAAAAIAGKHAVSGFLAVLASLDHDAGYIDAAVQGAVDAGASEEEVRQLRERLERTSKLQERYRQNLLASQEGWASKVAQRMLDTTKGSLTVLGSALSDLAITIGDAISPAVRRIAEALTGMANAASLAAQRHPVLTRVLVMGAGAALTASLAVSALGLAWAVVRAPILRAVTVAAAARAGLTALRAAALEAGGVGALLAQRWAGLKGLLLGVAGAARGAAVSIMAMTPAVWSALTALAAHPGTWVAGGALAAIAAAAILVRKYWEPITAYLGGVWTGIREGLGAALQTIGDALAPLAPIGQVLAGAFEAVASAVGGVAGWIRDILSPAALAREEFLAMEAAGLSLGRAIGDVLGSALMAITMPFQAVGTAVGWVTEKMAGLRDMASTAGAAVRRWMSGGGDAGAAARPAAAGLTPQPVAVQSSTTVHAPITVHATGMDPRDVAALIEGRLRGMAQGPSRTGAAMHD